MITGERLKELRIKANRTQTDFAADCGISKQLLYKYENSIITNIPTDRIELFARELGTTPAYLMGWTNDPYDWDNDPNNLISSIPLSYIEACNGNVQQAWKAMQAVDQDALSSPHYVHSQEDLNGIHTLGKDAKNVGQEDIPDNDYRKRILMLARKAADIPEEQRNRIIQNFEDTIDIYLEAKGVKKEEPK